MFNLSNLEPMERDALVLPTEVGEAWGVGIGVLSMVVKSVARLVRISWQHGPRCKHAQSNNRQHLLNMIPTKHDPCHFNSHRNAILLSQVRL